jgi:hippurate hydrolase
MAIDERIAGMHDELTNMLDKVSGCCINIGNGGGESSCEVHNAGCDFNDRALPLGVSSFVRLVETRLRKAG